MGKIKPAYHGDKPHRFSKPMRFFLLQNKRVRNQVSDQHFILKSFQLPNFQGLKNLEGFHQSSSISKPNGFPKPR